MGILNDFRAAPLWQQFVLVVLLGLIVLFGARSLFLKDAIRAHREWAHKLSQLEAEVTYQKALAQDYDLVRRQHQRAKNRAVTSIPSIDELSSRLGNQFAIAEAERVNIVSAIPGSLIDYPSYGALPISIEMRGAFSPLIRSMSGFEHITSQTVVEKLLLQQIATSTYQVNMELTVFLSRESFPTERRLPLDFVSTLSGSKSSSPLIKPKNMRSLQRKQNHARPPQDKIILAGKKAFVLQGFWKGNRQGAIVNGKLVFVGDIFFGYAVSQIEPSKKRIRLTYQGQTVVLKMNE